jgi:hypothetical protein
LIEKIGQTFFVGVCVFWQMNTCAVSKGDGEKETPMRPFLF